MPRVKVSKEIQFDAGHRVPNHRSKCRNPHGHRYRVVVSCIGSIVEEAGASDEGMLIDFSDLKILMTNLIHDPLDHGFIAYHEDKPILSLLSIPGWKIIPFPYIPTAENIAIWCWEQLKPAIDDYFRENLILSSVEVWETPTSKAFYYGT